MTRRVLATVMAVLGAACAPSAAHAAVTVQTFSITPAGTAAGGHPDVTISATFGSDPTPTALTIELPPGLIGNPRAVPRCTQEQFEAFFFGCPAASRVGSATATALLPVSGDVYNLAPVGDEPARLGVSYDAILPDAVRVQSIVRLRPSDGGLTTEIPALPGLPVTALGLTLEGEPAGAAVPFMTLPTSCVPATARIVARNGDQSATRSAGFTPTGCGAVPFAPGAALATGTAARGEPTSYDVTLTVPAAERPRRQAHVKRAEVVLPAGTALNPGVTTSGLEACTDAQFAGAGCPAAARIGGVTFATPLLATPLTGDVFFAAATPARRFGLFVDVDDRGVRLQLEGTVRPDPLTGRITTVFDDLPQVPFTAFTLSFRGGPDAVLVNSRTCAPQVMETRLTPYSGGPDATPSATFTATGCEAAAFQPALAVDVADRSAGRPAGAVTVRITRSDADEPIDALTTNFPPGLAGSLAGVGICAEDQIPACPESSRVGSVAATVGSGAAPVRLDGTVFLTGPAEGGLVGLAIVLPGKVGPIDLGPTVARAGIALRPSDGGLTVRTASLPRIVGGVPIAIRELALTLDRPGFMRNATACGPLEIGATFTSTGGAQAAASAPYRAERCEELAFTPTISATLGSRGENGRNGHPALTTVLAVPPGQAATRSVAVTLPTGVGADLARLAIRCSAAQAQQGGCPAGSRIGTARADTSLLPVPLTGAVHLADSGPGLPGLLVHFDAPVALTLTGAIDFTPQGLRATFAGVPDVPLERFELALAADGPLTLASDLCSAAAPPVSAAFTAHSGATAAHTEATRIAGCGPRAKLTVKRLRSGRPALRLAVDRAPEGAALALVRLRLPAALRPAGAKARRKGLVVRGGRGALSRAGVLTLRAPAGAERMTATLRRGTLRARRAPRRLAFRLLVADADRTRTKTTLRVRTPRR